MFLEHVFTCIVIVISYHVISPCYVVLYPPLPYLYRTSGAMTSGSTLEVEEQIRDPLLNPGVITITIATAAAVVVVPVVVSRLRQ
jgi:hypothetical protein